MIKKGIGKKLLALGLTALMVGSATACGGAGGSKKSMTVDFMYGGDVAVVDLYNQLIEEFNATKGKEEGIKIKGIPKTGSLDSVLAQQLPSDSGPDMVSVSDKEFKKYASYFDDMTGKIEQSALEDFYTNAISRYHYNIETTTSKTDDPLYGIPGYNDTTILYYNKTALENVGVICISVNEEDLAAFNDGTAKDLNGKTKKDYGIEANVPAKGFYRSIAPFVPAEGETNGSSWSAPVEGEVLIFNDRIPMNWDELEDIGLICTQDRNSSASTKYGYYSEYWFNYGWTVGGDCLEDLTGNGDWAYTIPSDLPNYIVGDGKTYTGVYSGITYNAGETLEIRDIVNAKAGDAISFKTDNKSYFKYTVNGTEANARDFSKEIADGTLVELPSMKDAFSRYCHLACANGVDVSPYPDAFTGSNAIYYFTSGNLAFLLEEISSASSVKKMMKDEWAIAPIPVYKTYTEPENAECDDVVAKGKVAAHSMGYSVSINKKSELKEEAYVFVNWLATDGQEFIAKSGNLSSCRSQKDVYLENSSYDNALAVLESVEVAHAGDWWYMPDTNWINFWANTLNGKVRYGLMDFEEFLYSCIETTTERLMDYKK